VSYTFRVIFEGVCGYVPDKRFFQPDPDHTGFWKRRPPRDPIRSLAVLLPDLRRPTAPKTKDDILRFPKFREPHFPLLKFRLADLREGTTRRVDLVCRDISQKEEDGLLFLRREQVRFHMSAENKQHFSYAGWSPQYDDEKKLLAEYDWFKKLPKWWGKIPDLGSREQLESLWWLPALDRIVAKKFSEATKARTDVLPSYRGPFPEGLIARIECTGGRLRTLDFNRGVDGFPLSWRFAPPDDAKSAGSWNLALSNSLALEFFDVRGDVHIELKRLANEVVVEELVLAPAPGASRPVLEILISNREPDLLFQEEGFSRSTLPDMDFQPLYEQLSQVQDPKSEIIPQLPVPHPAKDTFFGIREKPCAGGSMLGQEGVQDGD
jgi:hypothetical protein